MTTENVVDMQAVEAFAGKAVGDFATMGTVLLAAIGDRLGLFKALAAQGPAGSQELATRAGIDERYALEWLAAMHACGYLSYDTASGRFALPAEHAPALAAESSPAFIGGFYQLALSITPLIDQFVAAFRDGRGIPQAAYPASTWEGTERMSAGWFEHLLLPVWLAALPELEERLRQGAAVADVGCGAGRALIKLAQAFPTSRFTGIDSYAGQIERARENVAAAGLSGQISFEQRDAARGLSGKYDLITTFDVVHDAADPRGLLRGIRQALKPGGVYLCVDFNCGNSVEANTGLLGMLLYSSSIFYCMTTSLAAGGAGLGAAGLPEGVLRDLCLEAGFGSVRRVALDDPFNNLYEIRP
jgi:2-polyprenyl-3-methyl-5-hydroxy-6-metoxy-1,4-benzoquinol methylase